MVVSEDQDGKSDDCLALAIQSDNTNEDNTRKGGMQSEAKTIPKVIVDMREFRSELPAILYTRGIKIEPMTLVVNKIYMKFINTIIIKYLLFVHEL